MKGFTFGLTRRVENHWIDVDKTNTLKKSSISYKDDSSNGYYPSVIIPKHLLGRRVLIIPVDEDNTVLTLEELMEDLK